MSERDKYIPIASSLSSNCVQATVIADVLVSAAQYDDIWDVANNIAALKKVITHLEKSTAHHWRTGELDVAVAHAMHDWKVDKEVTDPFNPPKQ